MAFIVFLDGQPYGYYDSEDDAEADSADLDGEVQIVEDDGDMP